MPDTGGGGDTVQRQEPPRVALPYIEGTNGHVGVLPEAQRIYESSSPSYFPGLTVAPLAPESEIAFTAGANRALSGSPLTAAASSNVMDTLSGAYLPGGARGYADSPYTTAAGSYAGNVMDGDFLRLGGDYLGERLAGDPLYGRGRDYASDVIGGRYLDAGNPYLGGIRDRITREASGIAGMFSGGGRTGSGAETETIARAVAEGMAPYEFGTYERERAMQQAAADQARSEALQRGGMDLSAFQAERGAQADAARLAAGLGGEDLNLYLAERGLMQNAMQAAPQLAATDYQDIDYLRNIGALRQAQGQAELSDEVSRWNFGQNVDQAKLDNLLRAVYGVPGSTTYTSGGGPSTLQTGLGTAASLAGLGMMFLSDERMKEGIEPADTGSVVDKLIDLPISEWSYIEDDTRHIGPMAQEMQERFGVGDGRTIHMADVAGIMLSAVKEMAKEHRGFMGPRRTA